MTRCQIIMVRTARYAVRAAFSGAAYDPTHTSWQLVPPALTRAGTSQRDVPTSQRTMHEMADRENILEEAVNCDIVTPRLRGISICVGANLGGSLVLENSPCFEVVQESLN
jgi:hypothetical protein